MILAANFKTNHTRASTQEYLNTLNDFALTRSERFFIFPPASALTRSTPKITVGAQNAYATNNGSFTGELGLEQLAEFGINTVLIGHSERRHILKESLELIEQKFNFYKSQNFTIFFCIGETLEIKEKGAVLDYIKTQLKGIDLSYKNLVLAYEPVWAIGTGKSASSTDIAEIHAQIKQLSKAPLLYGGSVKADNFKEIANIANVDGVLVGTSSWDVSDFIKMIN